MPVDKTSSPPSRKGRGSASSDTATQVTGRSKVPVSSTAASARNSRPGRARTCLKGGGVLVDVDGNSLIDMGAGIAVVNVGNAADKVVENVQAQVAAFTHTCFMVTPYSGYVEVCEALNRLTPGEHAKKSALFNSGAE